MSSRLGRILEKYDTDYTSVCKTALVSVKSRRLRGTVTGTAPPGRRELTKKLECRLASGTQALPP